DEPDARERRDDRAALHIDFLQRADLHIGHESRLAIACGFPVSRFGVSLRSHASFMPPRARTATRERGLRAGRRLRRVCIGPVARLLGIGLGADRAPLGASLPQDSQIDAYPEVVKVGATYRMWYGGYNGSNYRILAATSTDGTAWTKLGVSIDLGLAGSQDGYYAVMPKVAFVGGQYMM